MASASVTNHQDAIVTEIEIGAPPERVHTILKARLVPGFCMQISTGPRLRGDSIAQSIGVVAAVFANVIPASRTFGHLVHAFGFARSEVSPGVIARDNQVIPGAALEVLHKNKVHGGWARGGVLNAFSSWSRCPGTARQGETTYTEPAVLPASSPSPIALTKSGQPGPLAKVSVCQA
jgi:hypothetical protein